MIAIGVAALACRDAETALAVSSRQWAITLKNIYLLPFNSRWRMSQNLHFKFHRKSFNNLSRHQFSDKGWFSFLLRDFHFGLRGDIAELIGHGERIDSGVFRFNAINAQTDYAAWLIDEVDRLRWPDGETLEGKISYQLVLTTIKVQFCC